MEKFASIYQEIIGNNQYFDTPYGRKRLIYADWTASGRMYGPIEKMLIDEIYPFVGNTHTETTVTGTLMTKAYQQAKQIIKKHVNAHTTDCLIFCGSGMTAAINKLQRILGFKVPEKAFKYLHTGEQKKVQWVEGNRRPIVFISHMEHHSNHTSWLETVADVEIINPTPEGLIDYSHFEELLAQYADRSLKIASVTAASNVTGIQPDYARVARMIHAVGGYCFVDFACSAPYVAIDMHPSDPEEQLDAIYFSPHKFLGGPGSPGVLIFNQKLYDNRIPDHPGGGTVTYTNPWKFHEYLDDIEDREDGGTPPFLQAIKSAMAVQLKEYMGVEAMLAQEKKMVDRIFERLEPIANLRILAGQHRERLGVIAFYIENVHYNLVARLLNDRFGVQLRGGCACAGTYGHYLLDIDQAHSLSIYKELSDGNQNVKPGWVRLSIHPTMPIQDLEIILDAIEQVANHAHEWAEDYNYEPRCNEYVHISETQQGERIEHWFQVTPESPILAI